MEIEGMKASLTSVGAKTDRDVAIYCASGALLHPPDLLCFLHQCLNLLTGLTLPIHLFRFDHVQVTVG